MVNWIPLILFPLIVLTFGMLGGLITSKKIPTWYKYIVKPKFNPPNWIFAPVWTILYLMIGFAGYFAYEENGTGFSKEKFWGWFFYFWVTFASYLSWSIWYYNRKQKN